MCLPPTLDGTEAADTSSVVLSVFADAVVLPVSCVFTKCKCVFTENQMREMQKKQICVYLERLAVQKTRN